MVSMAVWAIKRGVDVAAGEYTTERDEIDLKLSFFRGPNRLIWYSRNPGRELLLGSSSSTPFYFVIGDGGGTNTIQLEMTLESMLWNFERSCMEIRLVPNAFYYMNLDEGIGLQTVQRDYSNTDSLSRFVKYLFPIEYRDNVFITDTHIDRYIFKSLSVKGTPIDVLAKVADDAMAEFYINDNYATFGIVGGSNVEEEIDNIEPIDNNTCVFVRGGKVYNMITTKGAVYGPGNILFYGGIRKRIIYTHITSTTDNKTLCTVIAVDPTQIVSEPELASILDEIDSNNLWGRIRETRNNSSFLIKSSDTHSDEFAMHKYVESYTKDRNLSALNFGDYPSTYVTKTSPYAGATVGVQYPSNIGAYGIALTHEGERHTAMEVAQLWNNGLQPTRESLFDYRLTLPLHTTLMNRTGFVTEGDPLREDMFYIANAGQIRIGQWPDHSHDIFPGYLQNVIEVNTGHIYFGCNQINPNTGTYDNSDPDTAHNYLVLFDQGCIWARSQGAGNVESKIEFIQAMVDNNENALILDAENTTQSDPEHGAVHLYSEGKHVKIFSGSTDPDEASSCITITKDGNISIDVAVGNTIEIVGDGATKFIANEDHLHSHSHSLPFHGHNTTAPGAPTVPLVIIPESGWSTVADSTEAPVISNTGDGVTTILKGE